MSNYLNQILDPDPSDAAVVGEVLGARGDVSYDEYGSVALTAGQTEVEVAFLYTKETADYRFEYLYVEDANAVPEDIRAVVNLKTTYGFTVQLSGAPDTNLSILRWHVMSPDPLHVTQPPTSQPRYVLIDEPDTVTRDITARNITFSGLLAGTGAALTDLAASQVTSGIFPPARLGLNYLGIGDLFLADDGFYKAIAGSVGGTVTNVSVVTANGFSGSVANPTTTPAITLSLATTLTEGAGLAGNTYDLSANRTLALGTPSALSVSSTNTATGTTHTHAVTSSANPGAAASLLATNSSGQLTLVDLLANSTTFNLVNTVATTVNLAGAATVFSLGAATGTATLNNATVALAGTLLNPVTSYNTDIGQLSKKFKAIYAAELWVETLVAQNTIATIGGRILVGPTTSLIADLSSGATTMDVKHNQMSNGDRVYLEGNGNVEFIAVTSAPSTITGGFRYTITRNLDGTGANAWLAGDAVFNTGTTGNGFIDLYSVQAVKGGSQLGPTIVGNVRNSSTYNDWTENWAIGNLVGLYGYGATTNGVGIGKYASGATNLTVDSTNGIRIRNYTTILGQWDVLGNILVGQTGAAQSNVYITSGAVKLRNNTTDYITLDASGNALLGLTASNQGNVYISGGTVSIRRGTTDYITLSATDAQFTNLIKMTGASAAISLGSTPPTSATVGTGVWLDRNGLYSLSSNTQNATLTSAGLTAGGGNVILNSNGLIIDSSSVTTTGRVNWVYDPSGTALDTAYLVNQITGTASNTELRSLASPTGSTGATTLLLTSENDSGYHATVKSTAYGTAHATLAGQSHLNLYGAPSFQGVAIGSTAVPTHMLDVHGAGWFQGDLYENNRNISDAWTAFTPTITSGSGTLTSVSATGAYKRIGKTICFRIKITITTNGTGATYVQTTLPVNPITTDTAIGYGNESGLTGKGLAVQPTGNALVARFSADNSYPGADGAVLRIGGVYEVA